MRGRKPTPTALVQLHGNPSRLPPRKDEPKPVGDLKPVVGVVALAPPNFSPSQRGLWDFALRHAPPGLLKNIDTGALTVWVVAADMHQRAYEAQGKLGLLVKAKNSDVPVQSPYLAIINRQAFIMMKAASELGFTPVSRPRIFTGAPQPTGEALNGGQETTGSAGGLDQWFTDAPGPSTQH